MNADRGDNMSNRRRRGPRPEEKRNSKHVNNNTRDARASSRGRRKRRKSGRGDIVSGLAIIACLVVFCIAAFQLLSIVLEYKAGSDSYASVLELAVTVPDVIMNEEGEEEPLGYEYYFVDFDVLLAQNSETVGWIRFDAPEIISYPLLQTEDNSQYLTTTFEGVSNSSGAIFLDKSNDPLFTDDNTIIYGHNMKNDSMFGALNEYNDGAFYEEYPYFYIYTPDGKASKYQVVAACVIQATDLERYTTNFASDSEYQSYIDEMLQTSYYDTGTEINTNSKLVTLSTCTGTESTRFIVQGVKIEEKDMVKVEE